MGALYVDLELSILSPTSKLAHFLSFDDSAAFMELQGCSLMRFIAGSDHQRFRDFMASSCDDPAIPASALPLSMQNVHGEKNPVDIFQVNLEGLSGKLCHLFGIRETLPGLRHATTRSQEQEPPVPQAVESS